MEEIKVSKKLIIYILLFIIILLGIFIIQDNNPYKEIKFPENHMYHMLILTEEQFIFEMIPHHQEAIDTSKIINQKTDNPKLKQLTQEIIDAQQKEILVMEDWKKIYEDVGIDVSLLERCNWAYGKIMNQYLKKVSPESAGFQTPIIKFFSYRLKGALDCD